MQFPPPRILRVLKSARAVGALAVVTALTATFASLSPVVGAAQSVEPAKAVSGTQLVVNGGFEHGLEGWKINTPASDELTITGAGLVGRAAQLSSDGEIVVLNSRHPAAAAIRPGTAYTMTAYARTTRVNAVAQLRVREVTDDAVQSHTARLKLTDTKWHRLTLSFTTSLQRSKLDLNVLFWNIVKSQYVFVDDVSLVKTSTAMVGDGAATAAMNAAAENSRAKSESGIRKPAEDSADKSIGRAKSAGSTKDSSGLSNSKQSDKASTDSDTTVHVRKSAEESRGSIDPMRKSDDSAKSSGPAKKPGAHATSPATEAKSPTKDAGRTSDAVSQPGKESKSGADSATKPSSTSASPATGCAPNAVHGTKFGVNLNVSNSGTLSAAWTHAVNSYGTPDVVRSFNRGAPSNWAVASVAKGADLSVSFKILPKDVLSGKYDAQLRSWFRSAPTNVEIYWTYYHEPEDQIEDGTFSAAEYRAAWKHIVRIQRESCQPNLHSMLILMGWSVAPGSGRTFSDYYAGSKYIDVLGWDPYNPWKNNTEYKDPSAIFGRLISVSKAQGKPFAIAETGSLLVGNDNGTGRAAWLKRMANYLQDNGALFVTYFDTLTPLGNDFRLTDSASKKAWRTMVGLG